MASSPWKTVHISLPGTSAPRLSCDVPENWDIDQRESGPVLTAAMPREEAGPFGDNVVVMVEPLGTDTGTALEEIVSISMRQLLLTVPDFHLLDEGSLRTAGREGWLRVHLHSAENSATVVQRQIFWIEGTHLITITLSALPFRDDQASRIFAHLLDSLNIVEAEEERHG